VPPTHKALAMDTLRRRKHGMLGVRSDTGFFAKGIESGSGRLNFGNKELQGIYRPVVEIKKKQLHWYPTTGNAG